MPAPEIALTERFQSAFAAAFGPEHAERWPHLFQVVQSPDKFFERGVPSVHDEGGRHPARPSGLSQPEARRRATSSPRTTLE